MAKTTEWVVECEDADGDITEASYFPTEREARAYRDRVVRGGEAVVKLAKVTNTWHRDDPSDLLDRTYDYR